MSATIKLWVNDSPPQVDDADLNGFKDENNNLIVGSGQLLSTGDRQQTHKAVSVYAHGGSFYTDSGVADVYVLSPVGLKTAPPSYFDGMGVVFLAGNVNTGAATINVASLGAKNIKLDNGGDPLPRDISAFVELVFTAGSDVFTLLNPKTSRGPVDLRDFLAQGDDSANDTTETEDWLDYLIANDAVGIVQNGTFLIDTISKVAANGIRIIGNGVFKATGSQRLEMIKFTGVEGDVKIDGPTFDANNLVSRPLTIENSGASPSALGDVHIGEATRFIRILETVGFGGGFGCYIHGGFGKVTFDGEIDGVDGDQIAGANTSGLAVLQDAGADDYTRHTVVTSLARIRNVRNDNTILADADGIKVRASVTSLDATLSVATGALFEECKGRAIKSQVVNNQIDSPTIKRSLYDGIAEINLQYSGGYIRGANIIHTGRRVENIIAITQRSSPANTQCSISDNELTVLGSPATNTGSMVSTDVTDAAVKVQGITIRDNKVKGEIDTFSVHRVANVVDVNRIIIDGNWAETIANDFITTTLFGAARAQLSVVFTNNGCENGCSGAAITDDLIVEYARNNHGITALADPFIITIAGGVLTPFGASHRVETEGAAASDDVDTIPIGNRGPDDWLTLQSNFNGRDPVFKNGTGNLELGADFTLNRTEDRLVLAPNPSAGTWSRVSSATN